MTNQLTSKERELILQEIESLNQRIDRCIEYQKSSIPFTTSDLKDELRLQGLIYLNIKNHLKQIIINNKF
jgi:hypothetical protein